MLLGNAREQCCCGDKNGSVLLSVVIVIVGVIRDPCQRKPTIRSLDCTSSLHSADIFNVSVVKWILDSCIHETADANIFVERTDLLNRYKRSHRSREGACRAVNSLAPMALPGEPDFWETIVAHKKVWADMTPQDPPRAVGCFSVCQNEGNSVCPTHASSVSTAYKPRYERLPRQKPI